MYQPGERIARFEVVRRLGEGGMGAVFEARDPELDRAVAIKVLHGDGETLRLLREAQALAKVDHPNVISVYELGTAADRVFIAMELVEGETLDRHLAAVKPSWRDTVALFAQAGRGLAAVHAKGLVHRDFKPTNVLVDRAGVARVSDFGLARYQPEPGAAGDRWTVSTVDERTGRSTAEATGTTGATADLSDGAGGALASPLTRTGAVMGTPRYMAPEQHVHAAVTDKADQFAFAVALWEALYGEHPFGGDDRFELAAAVIAGRRRPAPAGRGVPGAVERIVARALAADPEARWPSMTALVDALVAVTRRRKRLALVGVAVALAGGAAVAGAFVARGPGVDCARAGDAVASAWTPAMRDAITARFAAIGKPWATGAGTRTIAALDTWVASWRDARVDACRATHDRGDQSPALLDRRMACLDGELVSLSALTTALAAGTEQVERSLDAVDGLPSPDLCNAARLQTAGPESSDPRVREVAAAIARAQTARDLGRDARAAATEALAAARALGDPGLLARALALYVGTDSGPPAEQPAALEEALQLAAAARDPQIEATVARQHVRHAIYHGETGRIDALMPVLRAAVTRAGSPRSLLAEVVAAEIAAAMVLRKPEAMKDACARAGEYVDAIPAYVEQCECALPLLARDVDGAVAGCERAVAAMRARYGDRSPDVSNAMGRQIIALNRARRSKEALALGLEHLALVEEQHGKDSEEVAVALLNLSGVQNELGDLAGSRASLERALAVHDRLALPPDDTRAGILTELAYRLDRLGEKDAAIRQIAAAVEVAEQVYGPDHAKLALALQRQAGILVGRPAERARGFAAYRRAVEVAGRAQGATSPMAGMFRVNLAYAHLDFGSAADALVEADRAIAILEQNKDVYTTAGAHMGRGEALIKLRRTRDAREALNRGRELAVSIGEGGAARVAEIDALLAKLPPPKAQR